MRLSSCFTTARQRAETKAASQISGGKNDQKERVDSGGGDGGNRQSSRAEPTAPRQFVWPRLMTTRLSGLFYTGMYFAEAAAVQQTITCLASVRGVTTLCYHKGHTTALCMVNSKLQDMVSILYLELARLRTVALSGVHAASVVGFMTPMTASARPSPPIFRTNAMKRQKQRKATVTHCTIETHCHKACCGEYPPFCYPE